MILKQHQACCTTKLNRLLPAEDFFSWSKDSLFTFVSPPFFLIFTQGDFSCFALFKSKMKCCLTVRPTFALNTLKLSYSCMPNVKSTIHAHNKCLLKQTNPSETIIDASLCNCRKKQDCPLENQCLTRGIV